MSKDANDELREIYIRLVQLSMVDGDTLRVVDNLSDSVSKLTAGLIIMLGKVELTELRIEALAQSIKELQNGK